MGSFIAVNRNKNGVIDAVEVNGSSLEPSEAFESAFAASLKQLGGLKASQLDKDVYLSLENKHIPEEYLDALALNAVRFRKVDVTHIELQCQCLLFENPPGEEYKLFPKWIVGYKEANVASLQDLQIERDILHHAFWLVFSFVVPSPEFDHALKALDILATTFSEAEVEESEIEWSWKEENL